MKEEISIKAEGLTRAFGANIAVDGLDLEIRKGELFGLVGPDGAGKTTALRLLSGIMEPTRGDALVAGYSVVKEPELVKEHIGYMPQRFGLYEDLTVSENIAFYADIFEVPSIERPARTERLLGFSNLTPFKDRLAGKLSGGMKQKLGLACALIHTPKVLLLDEPTNGVDPVSRRDFWRILYGLLKDGITILISTAYLDEAERSTRVGLLHKGKLLIADEPKRIKEAVKSPMVEVLAEDARGAAGTLKSIEGVESVSVYGEKLHLAIRERALMENILKAAGDKGVMVTGYREIPPSLEDVFISMVER
ncbi:MAG: ABC transporter ATP-binding protein [Deltaproteobacteria bacterium]|nr:ABC transporter ATP-binding protein [Deltaproteobacteria bacterium]